MAHYKAKKHFRPLLATYLVIAVLGLFTFSALEAFLNAEGDAFCPLRGSGPKNLFATPLAYAFDCLAEEIITIERDNKYASSSPRGGTPRVFLPTGTKAAAPRAVFLAETLKEHHSTILRNAIPVKLRI